MLWIGKRIVTDIGSRLMNYITPKRLFIPVWLVLGFSLFLTGCQGFNPFDLTPQPGPSVTPTPATAIPTLPVSPTPSPSPTPLPVSTLDVSESDLQGVTVQFWHTGDQAPGEEVLGALADEFNRSNEWGITIQTTAYASYGEVFRQVQASLYGEFPDLIVGFGYQAASLDTTGERLVDLNEYVHDPIWGFTPEEVADFTSIFWESEEIGGKRLGIPYYRSAQLVYYNQTWASELGFRSPPDSPEAFMEQACAAAQASPESDPEGEGGWVLNTDPPTLLGWIFAFGGQAEAAERTGYEFNNPATIQAFEFLYDLNERGCAWFIEGRYPNAEFASRRALFVTGPLTGIEAQALAMLEAGSQDRWTAIPFPGAASGGTSAAVQPAVTAYGPSFSVLKTAPEKQLAAWLFIRWLSAPENQARWAESYGAFPSRSSTLDLMEGFAARHPQWAAALDLLPYARLEPAYASWSIVGRVLSDAGGFLFSPFFSTDNLPALVEELDQTAAELHAQYR
jgi:multiple sugar transport system substrate-binding protein